MKKQINFRLDLDLLEKLKKIADLKRMTVTSLITLILREWLLKEEER